MSEKVVYVPRSWSVTINGNAYSLRANEEYRIVTNDGTYHDMTIANVLNKDGKSYIVPKVLMYHGCMNVMEKVGVGNSYVPEIDTSDIESIFRITTTYIRAARSTRDINAEGTNTFTFAFDTDKYASQYRITIYQGEFVCLALKNNFEAMRSKRSMYGHIIDVDFDNNEIKFMRYVTKHGVRDVYPTTVKMDTLLGIYRHELGIEEKMEETESQENASDSASTEE